MLDVLNKTHAISDRPERVWEHRYYDGNQVFLRTQANGTILEKIIWGPSPDEVISRWTPEHAWLFYHQDPINSTVAITDANRNVVERVLTNAYGQEDIRVKFLNKR